MFVYGSLMMGEANHAHLQGAPLWGRDFLHGATLLDGGAYPFLVFGPGVVWGECYGISTNLLSSLDEFEEHPNVYCRQWVMLASGREAWTYVGQLPYTSNLKAIAGGNWRDRALRVSR
ncbi:MAG: gamma-glutamylcyclotransferase family protein [Cyanobacteria bacterium P01_E01_bin.48]